MNLQYKLTGLADVIRRLDMIRSVPYGAEMEEEILAEAGDLIAERWRELVPQEGPDHPYATDRYKDSIFVEPQHRGLGQDPEVLIATDAVNPDDGYPYPMALEYGTSRMAPQPSFEPAVAEAGPAAADYVGRAVAERVEEIW